LNEEKLKQYFLGKLSKAYKSAFEEEIAIDNKLAEEAQIVENELIDDYLRGNFGASDRELFEANYLTTDARREKLSLGKSVWRVASERQTAEIVVARGSLSFWQRWNAWRVAFAGMTAILLAVAFIFLWFRSPLERQLVQKQKSNLPATRSAESRIIQPLEVEDAANRNANKLSAQQNINASPSPKKTPTPKKESGPTMASFALLPGTLRDEGEQFVRIRPNTSRISLRLILPNDANKYQSFSAVLKTADGGTVVTASNLKALSFTLPAVKLENRTYIIFLAGHDIQNQPEPVAEYTFRVRR
jgi:hypothetical protein